MPAWFFMATTAITPIPQPAEIPAAAVAVSPIPFELPEPEVEAGFDAGRTGFTVTTPDGVVIGFDEFTLFVRPGETLDFVASRPVHWLAEGEVLNEGEARTEHAWQAAQAPGLHDLTLAGDAGEVMTLHLVVMRQREAGDRQINGYAIGDYPAEPYRGQENYRAPEFFVEVADGIEDLPLSPHFTLGQFLCKQDSGEGPAYLVVSERLVIKLENILDAVNAHGWRTDGFTVMSGYRTPAYNAGLGNGANSRHIYGGAADIFIDTDGNGVMDDLNGDGSLDRRDAAALYDLVEGLAATGDENWQAGGLGEYGPNSHHGAFVHVDERGWRARWGRS